MTTVPMSTNIGELVTCYEGLLPIILLHPLVMWSCKITWETETSVSPLPQHIRILGKVVTYYKKFQPIKSHNPLNTWSRKVT